MSENYLTEKDQNQLRNDVDLKMGLISTSEKLLFQIRKYEADIKKLKERIEQSNPICCHGYNSRTKPNPFDSTILVVNRLKITSKPMSGCFLKKKSRYKLEQILFYIWTVNWYCYCNTVKIESKDEIIEIEKIERENAYMLMKLSKLFQLRKSCRSFP